MSVKRVYSCIGGQAVLEGIMMKNGSRYALAVRKPDKEIAVDVQPCVSKAEKYPILGWPFIRGIFSFVDSLSVGLTTIQASASLVEEEDENYEPTNFEKWLYARFGDKTEKVVMDFALVIAVIFAVLIFMLIPMFISSLLKKFIDSHFLLALIEGVLRIAIFVFYIKAISHMDDINRTFMYHGAEHKCINCVELGHELTVENVMASSKEHKRCGTSFIVIVMIISILFFMFIKTDSLWTRVLSRILLIPVIAGVSYEFLRIAGRSESKIVNILSRPGMWMQGLTTKEPTADMAEVAIKATEAVFDWRAFLTKEFPELYPDGIPYPEADASEEDKTVSDAAAEETSAGPGPDAGAEESKAVSDAAEETLTVSDADTGENVTGVAASPKEKEANDETGSN